MSEDQKYYKLIHPGGPGGIVLKKPRMKKQDRRFKSAEFYMAVFFPKITGLFPAQVFKPCLETLSQTPEAAIVKKMDGIAKGETWETYHDAGWRIRKVKILDMGDAD